MKREGAKQRLGDLRGWREGWAGSRTRRIPSRPEKGLGSWPGREGVWLEFRFRRRARSRVDRCHIYAYTPEIYIMLLPDVIQMN